MQVQQFPQAGTQWVDGPGAAPQAPVQQDMVFQWVDSPSYARPAQQHYLQPPLAAPASPYYPGMDRHLDPSGLAQMNGLDPRAGAQYGALGGAAGAYDPRNQYVQRPPHPLPGYDPYRQGWPRSPGPPKIKKGAPQSPGERTRQAAGGRQSPDARSPSGAGGGSGCIGARPASEQSPEAYLRGVVDSMGAEALKQVLVSTLESLYEDRIKPMANYVKGRLKERSTPEPLVKGFVELYQQHPDVFLVQQPPPGSQADEVTIFFVTEPSWFKGWIDIDAADDPYDEVLWAEFAKFLDGELMFAGGRYGMARELMKRNLLFLAAYSLGEVCHMVQLAIQHRKLIVYHRKMLKPIQSVICPSSPGGGATAAGAQGEEIKDMDDLCMVLFRMLIHHPQGIRLCRMKQMIKHEYCRTLTEMAFQCTKLIELFNQEPLAATFVLDTENDGKSIYVRLGNPETFADHIKRIYDMATATEANSVRP